MRSCMSVARTLKAANWSGNVVSKSSSCRLRIRCDRGSLQIVAGLDPGAERALVGEDFGARDPYAGELESGFGEKPLGNYDTEHVIKPPDAIREFTGLSSKKCLPSQSDAVQLLEERDINILRAQCAGWRVSKSESGKDCIECDWKVKDAPSGEELMKRIMAVADAENHHPKLEFDDVLLTVRAELFTHVKGGLTINDFILAAKINDIEIGDLTPKRKQKFWA
ncbi:Putative pterin-4-alpha-carbinolamine dehydratase [Picochlorum sp. SENEW3]|nr:Putative pterin-4-alpha-carbinolamine dehydratase [Picochlorum sp. SENEW3]